MGNYLPDGTVLPSFMSMDSFGGNDGHGGFSTFQFLTGEVKKIIYPDDDLSLTKKHIEYQVDVPQRGNGGVYHTVAYPHCLMVNTFGGIADFSKWTLREDSTEQEAGKNVGTGTRVLMLCVDGDTAQCFIIGGIRTDEVKDAKDDGHNFKSEFNGVNVSVNKDGELTIKYRGATKVDGTLSDDANKDAEGTNITFNKDGNVTIATPSDKQFVRVNHKDSKIEISADQKTEVTCNGDVTIKSTGVKVGDATDAWMLGTTYRRAEGQMNNKLSTNFSIAQGMLRAASISLTSAAAAHAVPISGPIAGAPSLTLAAQLLQQVAGIMGQMGQAISTMEGGSSGFLSSKNKND